MMTQSIRNAPMLRGGLLALLGGLFVACALLAPNAHAEEHHWISAETEEPLSEPVNIDMDGVFQVNWNGSGFSCPVDAEATLLPGDEGEITAFDIEPEECIHFGSAWGSCKVDSASSEPPFSLLIGEGTLPDVLLSSVDMEWGFCGGHTWDMSSDDILLNPDHKYEINSFHIRGGVHIDMDNALELEAAAEGSLDLASEDAGLYAIS